MTRLAIIFFIITCILSKINAFDSSTLDSLKSQLEIEKVDTTRVRILDNIILELDDDYPDEIEDFIDQQLTLSKKIGYQRGISWANLNRGNLERHRGNFRTSIAHFDEAIRIAEKFDFKEELANAMAAKGQAYEGLSDFISAIEIYLQQVEVFKALENSTKVGILYNEISIIFTKLENHEKALEYANLALEIMVDLEHEFGQAVILGNQGNSLGKLGNTELAIQKYQASLELGKKLKSSYLLASCYNNLGALYDDDLGEYDTAIEYYRQAIPLWEELGIKSNKVITLANLGMILVKMGKSRNAKTYLDQALKLGLEIEHKQGIKAAHEGYYQMYAAFGDFEKALDHHKLYFAYQDTLTGESNTAKVLEIEGRYKSQVKEDEILLLKKEKEVDEAIISQQATVRTALVMGIAMIAFFSMLLVRGYRKRLNANRLLSEKEKEISDQKILELEKAQELNAVRAMMDGQEKERLRVAKDLHDSLGGMLSSVKIHFNELTTDSKSKKEFTKVNRMIDEACSELRSVAHDMMPESLLKFGLVTALEDLVGKLESREKLKIEVQTLGNVSRLASGLEIGIYRIIQELLNNIIKHAKAKEALIQLAPQEEKLNIIVEDDGVGFDPKASLDGDHMGLTNIQSRISYLNGEISFDSVPDEGTTVTIDIPLQS